MCDYCEYHTEPIYEKIVHLTHDQYVIVAKNFCPTCGEPLTEPKPLTLKQLREREGKPVYITYNNDGDGMWRILYGVDECFAGESGSGNYVLFEDHSSLEEWKYGKTWLAFDREPRKDGE